MTDITYALTEEEAKTVAVALIHMNNYLVGEFEKIRESDDVSAFIVEAARKQYNELAEGLSKLHVSLAQTFPVLGQR